MAAIDRTLKELMNHDQQEIRLLAGALRQTLEEIEKSKQEEEQRKRALLWRGEARATA